MLKKSYDVHKEITKYWYSFERKLENPERVGYRWLSERFEYVYWFAEHPNTKRKGRHAGYYMYAPFDYYAEKNHQPWFIEATTMPYKDLNKSLLVPFMRFAKVGVLFIKRDGSGCILKELRKPTSLIRLSKSELNMAFKKWSPNSAIKRRQNSEERFHEAKALVDTGLFSVSMACRFAGLNRDTYARHRDNKFTTALSI